MSSMQNYCEFLNNNIKMLTDIIAKRTKYSIIVSVVFGLCWGDATDLDFCIELMNTEGNKIQPNLISKIDNSANSYF